MAAHFGTSFIGSGSLYTLSLFTACRKEVGELWHCTKECARNKCLLCEISILKYCLVVDLFEKWRISLPPLPQSRDWWQTILAGHFGDSLRGRRHFWPPLGGGGGVCLGCPLAGFPQTQGNIVFRVVLHDFSLMLLMLYSPLDSAHLLVLKQPSGDGYFRLCSSKSSFRGILSFVTSLPPLFLIGHCAAEAAFRATQQRIVITLWLK
jgi:hypothetical protein